MKNFAEEVQNRINELLAEKRADVMEVDSNMSKAEKEVAEAKRDQKDATANMNLEAYEKAREKEQRARTAIEMYKGRRAQLERREFVDEEDSDRVIDGLLDYQKALAHAFCVDIAPELKKLHKMHEDYIKAGQQAEDTLNAWMRQIHPNYRMQGGSRIDPETGETTNRAGHPVPIHVTHDAWECAESKQLGKYLEKSVNLYKGE